MQLSSVIKQRSSELAKRGVCSSHRASAAISAVIRPGSAEDRSAWHLTCGFAWWQVLGSNQRRLSRRFYRQITFMVLQGAELRLYGRSVLVP
jgi:hypothetical protein